MFSLDEIITTATISNTAAVDDATEGVNSIEQILAADLVTAREIFAQAAIERNSINGGGSSVQVAVGTSLIGTVVEDGEECKKEGSGRVGGSVGSSTSADVVLAAVENSGASTIPDWSKSVRHKLQAVGALLALTCHPSTDTVDRR